MMINVFESMLFGGRPRRWSTGSLLGACGLAALVGMVYAGVPATAAAGATAVAEAGASAVSSAVSAPGEAEPAEPPPADLDDLAERVRAVSAGWAAAQSYYETNVAPIERVLLQYRRDPELAERVAVALVREANKVGLEPRLLLAVLLVENPWLDPKIRSPVGAIGLMQVMPVHQGAWSACGHDLEDIDDNVCYGARIFAHYFRTSNGNVERALLRYNGCVRGTNTPNCHQYPTHVFARAGRASVLAWLNTGPAAGSP